LSNSQHLTHSTQGGGKQTYINIAALYALTYIHTHRYRSLMMHYIILPNMFVSYIQEQRETALSGCTQVAIPTSGLRAIPTSGTGAPTVVPDQLAVVRDILQPQHEVSGGRGVAVQVDDLLHPVILLFHLN
jgi:hypothetical protein